MIIVIIIYPGDPDNLGKVELFCLWVVLLHSGRWGHWLAESWEGWTVIKGPGQLETSSRAGDGNSSTWEAPGSARRRAAPQADPEAQLFLPYVVPSGK